MVTNGDVSDFPINKDYDDCIREPNTANIIDTAANYVSDWVCKKPARHKCSFKSEIVAYNRKPDINADGSPALCRECTNKDNEFTRENVRRLIQRTYVSFLQTTGIHDDCLRLMLTLSISGRTAFPWIRDDPRLCTFNGFQQLCCKVFERK